MRLSKAELNEIQRCFQCDCATFPLCTRGGAPCDECFDAGWFRHRKPRKDAPGQFEQESESRSGMARPLVHAKIKELQTTGDGDCLYEALTMALNHYIVREKLTIAELRFFVSQQQTQERFQSYKALEKEYPAIEKTKTLREFKNVIQQCGSDTGPAKCMWGDENTLDIISNAYHLRFAIFNEKGRVIQTIEPKPPKRARRTAMLRINQSMPGYEHYSLFMFNQETLLLDNEWNWVKHKTQQ